MAGTQVQSVRGPLLVEDTAQYEIVSTCIEAGTLADTHIFLLSLVQPDDPKADTLGRVIEIADVAAFKTDRDEAIDAGDLQWRSPEVRILYPDIETANAAQKELSSRINRLVENTDINNTEFEVTNEIVEYPILDPSVKTDLENTYASSRTAANDAESTRDAKAAECVILQAERDVLQTRLTEAETDFQDISAYSAVLTSLQTSYVTSQGNMSARNTTASSLVDSSDATDVQKTGIQTELSAVTDELRVMSDLNDQFNLIMTTDVASKVAELQARVNTITSDLTSKNLEVTTCTNELTQLQGVLDAARATEDAALADVVAVCPDFDPNSV